MKAPRGILLKMQIPGGCAIPGGWDLMKQHLKPREEEPPHLVDGHGAVLLQLLIFTVQLLYQSFNYPFSFDCSSVVFLGK